VVDRETNTLIKTTPASRSPPTHKKSPVTAPTKELGEDLTKFRYHFIVGGERLSFIQREGSGESRTTKID